MWLKGLLTGIVSVDVETDDFFKVDKSDYTKLVGKSFINNKLGVAVKVIGIPEGNENHHWTPSEFQYEAFVQHRDKTGIIKKGRQIADLFNYIGYSYISTIFLHHKSQ